MYYFGVLVSEFIPQGGMAEVPKFSCPPWRRRRKQKYVSNDVKLTMSKPNPEQFDITQEQLEYIKSRNDRITGRLTISSILISLFLSIALVIYIVFTNHHYPAFVVLIISTIVIFPVFMVGGSLIKMIIIELYFYLLKLNSPLYRSFCEYTSARKEYEQSEKGET